MYKEKVLVTSVDVDNHLELKISSIFKFLQFVATNHAETIHIGQADTIDKGVCWVIIKMFLEIKRLPVLNEEIIVTTHPGETRGFIFPRYFQVYDKKGNLLINAASLWVLLNIETRKVETHPFPDRKFKYETSKEDLPIMGNIDDKDVKEVERRVVKYNDIDLNGHLNNVKYVEYMIDLHDKAYYDKYRVTSLLISYDKEIKDHEEVVLYSDNKLNETIRGEVDGASRFRAYITHKER